MGCSFFICFFCLQTKGTLSGNDVAEGEGGRPASTVTDTETEKLCKGRKRERTRAGRSKKGKKKVRKGGIKGEAGGNEWRKEGGDGSKDGWGKEG